MRRLGGAALLMVTAAAFAVGCFQGPPSPDETEAKSTTHQSIIGGTPSTNAARDFVVLLNENGNSDTCSGSLIAPNLLLTARHCVTEINPNNVCGLPLGRDLPASLFTISVGAYASSNQTAARGTRIFLPQNVSNGLCSADIALILLDKDVPNIASLPKLRFSTPAQGEASTAIGYGEQRGGGRRERNVSVLAIGPANTTYQRQFGSPLPMTLNANEVATGESTCFGDSGGPLLDNSGAIFAITSRGIDDYCDDRPTISITLSAHEALIRDALNVAGHPLGTTNNNGSPSPPTGTLDNPDRNKPADDGEDEEESSSGGARKPKASPVASTGCTSGARTTTTTTTTNSTALASAGLLGVLLVARRRRERR